MHWNTLVYLTSLVVATFQLDFVDIDCKCGRRVLANHELVDHHCTALLDSDLYVPEDLKDGKTCYACNDSAFVLEEFAKSFRQKRSPTKTNTNTVALEELILSSNKKIPIDLIVDTVIKMKLKSPAIVLQNYKICEC